MTATASTSPTTTVELDDVQVEAATLLRRLDGLSDQLELLRDSRQPSRPFVPRSTREAIGRQYKADRDALRLARAAGYPEPLGNTHAPGNIAAWTCLASIELALVDLRRRILKAHEHQGTCAIPHHVYDRPTKASMFTVMRELIFAIPTVTLARNVNRQLQHHVDEADRLIDGDERTDIDGRCPHCGQATLIVYLRAGQISCERPRDHTTHRRSPCRCPDPLCGCRSDPAGYIHTWYRDRPAGAADSWAALSSRLNLTHLARKKTTP